MFSFIIFVLSGVVIVFLIVAKTWEIRRHKSVWVLNLIGKADVHIREYSHGLVHKYSVYKEKSEIVIKKQLPLQAKNIANKTEALLRGKFEKYVGDIRNTRFLNSKNKEGISEFFKNMKDLEEETAEAIKDMDEANKGALEGEEKKG
ncbi:MAG: hypothetical protein WAV25_02300 [Minisyncoccia bacterium]